MMTTKFLFDYLKGFKLAVVSSVNDEGRPESALVGVAFSENLEVIFDTVKSSRKYRNLYNHPTVSLVVGWNDESTVQYEGIASELVGEEARKYKEIYFEVYPDGRKRAAEWPGLVHFIVKPKWIRYSDFNEPPIIEEISF